MPPLAHSLTTSWQHSAKPQQIMHLVTASSKDNTQMARNPCRICSKLHGRWQNSANSPPLTPKPHAFPPSKPARETPNPGRACVRRHCYRRFSLPDRTNFPSCPRHWRERGRVNRPRSSVFFFFFAF